MNNWIADYIEQVERTSGNQVSVLEVGRGRYVVSCFDGFRLQCTRREIEAFTKELRLRPDAESKK